MPDVGEVCSAAKVLCDSDGIVHVEYDMPPAARYKHSLPGSLENLDLENNENWPV